VRRKAMLSDLCLLVLLTGKVIGRNVAHESR
jgi:hypothetical protein